jgi:hypothetical protein
MPAALPWPMQGTTPERCKPGLAIAGDHAARQLARFQRGCHGCASGDRRQNPAGRTKDQNIVYVAEYLTAVGVDLRNVSAAPLRVTRVRSKGGPISAVESNRRS